MQHDLAAERAHRVDLQRGVVTGMTTSALQPRRRAASATPLRVVARRGADHAAGERARGDRCAILL